MKKMIFMILLCGYIPLAHSQDLGDALRYGMNELDGTARYTSMSGAFGALGGDLSGIQLNPAGSAVFLANRAGVSLNLRAYKNKADYADGHYAYRNTNLDLNQAGAVFIFNNTNEAATITRLSFGVAYGRNRSFKNRLTAVGNSETSISDLFLNYAQGVPLDLFTRRDNESLDDLYNYLGSADLGFNNNRLQTAYLGYETFIFDAADPSDMENTLYTSNVSGSSFTHTYHNFEHGMHGKLSFNGGIALKDRFYFGLNLNSHFIDYRRNTILDEQISSPSEINEITFGNYLDTKGTGFSFQVGGIARITDLLRVSLSYQSPVWYRISDETSQFLTTNSEEFGEASVSPQVINVFPDYHYRTPGKINAGAAAVLGKKGLISVGYSYQDFSNTKYTSSGFGVLNDLIDEKLQAVNTFRIGGEYRIKNFSLRAGFRYKNSPYKNDTTIGDLHGYSAGIGYDFGSLRLDFAYDHAERDYNSRLLHTNFDKRISVKNSLSHYVLTLSFPF